MANTRSKTSVTEDGVNSAPKDPYGKLINNASFWIREEVDTDEEIEARATEFRNLCAARSELPIVENFCLFLGVSLDKARDWLKSDAISAKRKKVLGAVITWSAAVLTQAWQQGLIGDVKYIWYSKQWYGMREPEATINIGGANPLKELPSVASVAERYLVDVAETEAEEENQ